MPLQSPIPLADGSKRGEMGAGRAATAASRARPRASGVSARPRASSDGGHRRAAAVTAASRRPRASRGRACSDGGEQAMAPASLRAAFSSASLRCLFSSFRVVGSATAASTFSSSTAALPSSSSCHLAPREEQLAAGFAGGATRPAACAPSVQHSYRRCRALCRHREERFSLTMTKSECPG